MALGRVAVAVDATYDTTPKKMTWTTTDSGLTGPTTTAHFSGPAELGKSAPPVVAISGNLVSPINREAILTDAQAFELQGSRWYFKVHTEANTGGEIRGQLMKK